MALSINKDRWNDPHRIVEEMTTHIRRIQNYVYRLDDLSAKGILTRVTVTYRKNEYGFEFFKNYNLHPFKIHTFLRAHMNVIDEALTFLDHNILSTSQPIFELSRLYGGLHVNEWQSIGMASDDFCCYWFHDRRQAVLFKLSL